MKKIISVLLFIFAFAAGQAEASGVSRASNYNPGAVAITGGTINGVTIGAATPSTIVGTGIYTTNNFNTGAAASYQLNNKMFMKATAPTIASGCGTAPSISQTNGTTTFLVNIGTAPSITCNITMPAATTGWSCTVGFYTWTANTLVTVEPVSTTQISLRYRNATTYASNNFPAGGIFRLHCAGY